jgi:proton-translocating NADH-quinone oxidoreductase chain M
MKISEILLSGIILLPVTGIFLLLLSRNASKKQAAVVAIISEGFALVIPIILLGELRSGNPVFFSIPWIESMGISFSLELNWLSLIFLLTEVLVTLVAMVYSLGEKAGEKSSNYYYALLLLFSVGMSGTTLADDVFLFYVFWELMLIASVLLILMWGSGENRSQVALKYFIITHIGSLMVLVCLITLQVQTGTASLAALADMAGSLPAGTQSFLTLFFLIGFCVKMAIFPLHIWLPDAHTVAPMPVTIVLAAAMLAMGTYGILRFPIALFPAETIQPFAIWMMTAGVISEIYGALMALAENHIKRIIAYSSVSQMGYILFGLGSLTEQGMLGGIMHVVYHAIVKTLLFMVVGIVLEITREKNIQKLGGLARLLPVTCVCAAIGVLGISGMPPLGIFNSEWMIFAGGFESGYPVFLTVVSLIGSLFTVFYGLRFFGKIFFGELRPEDASGKPNRALLIPVVAVTVFLVVEGLVPAPLLNWVIKGLSTVFVGVS